MSLIVDHMTMYLSHKQHADLVYFSDQKLHLVALKNFHNFFSSFGTNKNYSQSKIIYFPM